MKNLLLILIGICVFTSTLASAEGNSHNTENGRQQVEAVGIYHNWGHNYDLARKCAEYDAQNKCAKKAVKQISPWSEITHCSEGECSVCSKAIFECLPEDALPALEHIDCTIP